MRPLRDNVIVRLLGERKSEGGLFLPDASKKDRAVVVSVGPGKRLESGALDTIDVSAGSLVILNGAKAYPISGTDLHVIRGHELLAYIED
mgnify:CR=1 FL=1